MPKRILFVDDEVDVQKVAVFRLRKAGYEVVTAVNSDEALDWIQKERFDLIFLDLRLPGISGAEICKKIKSDENLKKTPVILFTASVRNLPLLTKEVGADDFLIKPFETEQLLEKVKNAIFKENQ
ncbi:MAG TPA: response regulator [Candidatus Omnitrophota bacterium]|nr:response regulator [Candidatus Omnitrophota bacterium]